MSHEIRTTMNVILGLTKVVLDSKLNQADRENLEIVVNAGDSLLTLINDILDLSKIESGKMDVVPVDFDLKEEIGSVIETFDTKAKEQGLSLQAIVEDDLPQYLFLDNLRVNQILVNLVSNGLKFTKEGSLTIMVKKVDQGKGQPLVVFSVADTGIGIPQEKQNQIFESFTQADSTTTRNFGGTGLGLTICKKLVDLMGGDLWVTSQINKGSTFYFSLPCTEGQEPANS